MKPVGNWRYFEKNPKRSCRIGSTPKKALRINGALLFRADGLR